MSKSSDIARKIFVPNMSNSQMKRVLVRIRNEVLPYCNPSDRQYIMDKFIEDCGTNRMSSVLAQLYAEYGVMPDEYNPYLIHANIIEKIFGLDRGIVDIR